MCLMKLKLIVMFAHLWNTGIGKLVFTFADTLVMLFVHLVGIWAVSIVLIISSMSGSSLKTSDTRVSYCELDKGTRSDFIRLISFSLSISISVFDCFSGLPSVWNGFWHFSFNVWSSISCVCFQRWFRLMASNACNMTTRKFVAI